MNEVENQQNDVVAAAQGVPLTGGAQDGKRDVANVVVANMTSKELGSMLAQLQAELSRREGRRNKALSQIASLCAEHEITLSELKQLLGK